MLFCLLIRSITSAPRHLDCHLDYRRSPRWPPPHASVAASLCYPKASDSSSPARIEGKAIDKIRQGMRKEIDEHRQQNLFA